MTNYSRIIGTGSYLPEKTLTNADLEKMVDTSDEWIISRSGIRERHIAAADESSSSMAHIAAQRALEMAGISADEIDMIVFYPEKCLFPEDRFSFGNIAQTGDGIDRADRH